MSVIPGARTKLDIYVFITTLNGYGLLIPEGIILPVISGNDIVYLFIRYICYCNLQFINNVIIIIHRWPLSILAIM